MCDGFRLCAGRAVHVTYRTVGTTTPIPVRRRLGKLRHLASVRLTCMGQVYWIHSASESSSSSAILYACMLLHWLNWHDPHALEQSSPYFLHRSVRHAVVHWVIFSIFCGYGSCYVITGNIMFFVSQGAISNQWHPFLAHSSSMS